MLQNMLSIKKSLKTIFLLLLYSFLSGQYDLVHADPPYPLCSKNAHNKSYSQFQKSLNHLFVSFASNSSVSKFHISSSSGDDSDKVYGLYMCLGYISSESCKNCITTASRNIMKLCPDTTEAVVWEEICQLRYSNKEFFGTLDVSGIPELHNGRNVSEPEQFGSAVKKMLSDLTEKAAFDLSPNKYYAAEERVYKDPDTLYAAVQCTEDLSPKDCKICLEIAITNVSYFYRGARLLSKSCYLRYELYNFYEDDSETRAPGHMWVPGKSKYLQMIFLSKL